LLAEMLNKKPADQGRGCRRSSSTFNDEEEEEY
jgi:hypothetical protein